ncbi:MAG: hypothetical protein IKG82_08250 [Oscillospiraceae bacterium]|nr:hypothetical protein [Oscillospiraceae bacterium]
MLDRETSAAVGKLVSAVVALLFAATVAGMMFFRYQDRAENRKLYTVPVTGYVQKCDAYTKRVRSSNGVYSDRRYYVVTVGYEIEGKKFSAVLEESRSYNTGAGVSLMYDPDTFVAVRLSETQQDPVPYMIGGGIILFSVLIGAVGIVSFLRGRNGNDIW